MSRGLSRPQQPGERLPFSYLTLRKMTKAVAEGRIQQVWWWRNLNMQLRYYRGRYRPLVHRTRMHYRIVGEGKTLCGRLIPNVGQAEVEGIPQQEYCQTCGWALRIAREPLEAEGWQPPPP